MAERLEISERAGCGLATIMAREGCDAGRIATVLGLGKLADGPSVSVHGDLRLIGTGPGTWLAVTDATDGGWAEGLAVRLAGTASVSDQTGGYILFRFAGADARDLLQRGVFIDLDRFAPGSAAVSVIAHIGVILWQVDAMTFDVAVFRSYASSFRDWIGHARAGLGA